MDPQLEFFAKLKKLCGTLETEAARLQQTFENRHDSLDSANALRAYHDFKSDVLSFKGQLQDELSEQKAHGTEVDAIIHACRAVQTKVAHNVRAITEHFENYGYKPPTNAHVPKSEVATLEEKESAENLPEKEEGQDNEDEEATAECSEPLTPPQAAAPSNRAVPMCTPKLSDFGLREPHLWRNFSKCGQQPAIPVVSLPPLDVPTPLPPKCTVRMDEDELRSPQMADLGFNSDFTMNLFRKNSIENRPEQDILRPPEPAAKILQNEEESLKSPELPVFCTPGFKIKKANGHCSPLPDEAGSDTQSPSGVIQLPDTPEVPTFQTPSLKRLLHSKKRDPMVAEKKDSHTIPFLETPLCGSALDRRAWEYDVTDCHIPGLQESEDLDGATQDFHLSPPRATREIFEISTPEMPDLSSVTQDICKLVMQSQKSLKRAEHKSRCMNAVSEQEFHSLPAFLKQMTLNSLNQAVHNINNYLVQCPEAAMREFGMEELKKITNVGIKAPVYMVCLSELQRLEPVEGAPNNTIYKLTLCN